MRCFLKLLKMSAKWSFSYPKTFTDASAVIFLIIATTGTYFFEVLVVVPYVHQDSHVLKWVHTLTGGFVLYNVMSNLLLLISTDTSTRSLMLPSVLKAGWRFCSVCEANAPPRSYHCQICDKCILKRDHHCVFSGCCVGYRNFRYYFGLLIYVSTGGFYASVLNMFFIWDALGGFGPSAILCHLFPLPFWAFGKLSFKLASWTLVSMINLLGFMFAAGLAYYHGHLMVNNQTTYERNHRIVNYNLGDWKSNVVQSLGRRWVASLLSPLIRSELPGNGIDFPTSKNRYTNKSK